jgi:L-seryl-tRNA(Ser) seleniumtransferase
MGLLAAVEAWVLGRDHDAEWHMWEGWLAHIQQAVADLPSVQTAVVQPGLSNHAPTLRVTWDPEVLHITPEQVHHDLFYGDPPVVMHLRGEGLQVMPYMMETGDAEIAAACLREALSKHAGATTGNVASVAPADVSGSWELATEYILGKSDHAMSLEQDGVAIEGPYRSQFQWSTVSGEVDGSKVAFQVRLGTQANWLTYKFEGEVSGDTMEGTVDLGEFWKAHWTAQRVSGG